jgi:hypothetical protein
VPGWKYGSRESELWGRDIAGERSEEASGGGGETNEHPGSVTPFVDERFVGRVRGQLCLFWLFFTRG